MRINPILTVVVLIIFAVINVDLAFSQDNQQLEKMAADKELEQGASKELDAIDEEIR